MNPHSLTFKHNTVKEGAKLACVYVLPMYQAGNIQIVWGFASGIHRSDSRDNTSTTTEQILKVWWVGLYLGLYTHLPHLNVIFFVFQILHLNRMIRNQTF